MAKKFNLAFQTDGTLKTLELWEGNFLKFSDGSIRVTLNPDLLALLERVESIGISAYLQTLDDLMIVGQIVDILVRNSRVHVETHLTILSPIYSRYDRVMLEDRSDSFGLRVFAKFLSSLGLTSITLLDPHSGAYEAILSAFGVNVRIIDQKTAFQSIYGMSEDFVWLCPDKGARQKKHESAYPPMVFDKERDVVTGEILGIKLAEGSSVVNNARYVLIDDICEGGRTFIGVKDALEKVLEREVVVDLYVTHGLFTNNAIERLTQDHGFGMIYTSVIRESTLSALDSATQNRVVPKIVIKDI